MLTATVTSKGQVTIPAPIRNDLQLEAGVKLAFSSNGDGSYTVRAATRPVTDLFGFLCPYNGPVLSVEQMNDAMIDAASEANR